MTNRKFTESSVSSCNVSYKDMITAETLIGILSGQRPLDGWYAHVETFFNELPKSYISGVMDENNLKVEQLRSVYEALPKVFQGRNFKEFLNHA